MIELAVLEAPWRAAEGDVCFLDACEDRVEFPVADVEGEVMALELVLVVEQERQRFVDLDRREMVDPTLPQAENVGEELGGSDLVARRHDGVVESDCHDPPRACARL